MAAKIGDEDFLKLYRTESNARGKVRFLALHHLQEGKSKKEVCSLLCISHHTLNSWLLWYDKGGTDRLRKKVQGRGAKTKVSASRESIQKAILKLQENCNGGRIIGKDIQAMLLKDYQVEYSNNYIYELLERLGLSWISSRSKHPKSDFEEQESFKKTLKKRS